MQGWKRRWKALAVLGVIVAVSPAASGEAAEQVNDDTPDWEAPIVVDRGLALQGLFDEDPTGLVPKTPFVQRYSLDQDHWEVWLCGPMETTMDVVITNLEAASVDYFDSMSGGLYEPVFHPGGTKPADADCLQEFIDGTYPTVSASAPEGLLIIDGDYGNGGYASPGTICISSNPDCSWIGSSFPDNRRYAVLGEPVVGNWPSVIVHELGHALQWPHSNSGTGGEYDNPIDLMSGNQTLGGWSEDDPYATLSYNRLQSGWVAEADVAVADGSYQLMTLQPHTAAGTQLLAIKTNQPGRFYAFGARTTSLHDPIPSAWQGVEVYEVDYYCDEPGFGGGICPGIYREHMQEPPSPGGVGHVLQVGESIEREGLTVTVTSATATGYTLTVDPGQSKPLAPGAPDVVPGDEQAELSWAAAGDGGSPILGYELEVDDRDGGSTVTNVGLSLATTRTGLENGTTYRARVRAMNAFGQGPWSGWSPDFIPGTVPSAPGVPVVVAGDGEIVAQWTPATGNGFAVDAYEVELEAHGRVTVGAVLTRTFTGLTNGDDYRVRVRARSDPGWGPWSAWSATATPQASEPQPPPPPQTNRFIDDDGSVFEADIEWLAAKGVTLGCNPPVNDRFCPVGIVTRGQMAAFLVRGLGLTASLDDPFIDDDGSVFESSIEKLAAAGITMGCNPPDNNRFCVTDPVTRGQMAAFLVRAIGYTDAGAGDLFRDDDGSIFEHAIDKLATAGVTRGCNPPDNDRFCPDDVVTRGQMAAFLRRALG